VCGEGVFVWLRKDLASDTGSPSPSRACTAMGSGRRHMHPFTTEIKSSVLFCISSLWFVCRGLVLLFK